MFRSFLPRIGVALCLATLSLGGGQSVHAQARSAALVIGDDRGGFVRARLSKIDRLRSRGQRVEIRGRLCLSSCTMYLGLENVCVDPNTTFGFHGPGMAIGQLTQEQFEYVSSVIAAHYPPQIKEWYMREGRMRTRGFYRMKGAELIRLGVAECPPSGRGNR